MIKEKMKYHLAKNHVAGPLPEDALRICKYIASKNYSVTLSAWTNEKDDASDAAEKYIQAIEGIISNNLDAYLSIKPPAIGFKIALFEKIAGKAVSKNIRIHFDSLTPRLSDATLEFLKEAIKIYPNIGYTIPSRWDRSLSDVKELISLGIPAVRIVKGQWLDPVNSKINAGRNFLSIVERLAGNIHCIAIATHDAGLAKRSIEIVKRSVSECELEQFFSLPASCEKLAGDYGIGIRFYVAFGAPYMPYNLKFALERPAMLLWMLRDAFNINPFLNNGNKDNNIYNFFKYALTKN